MCKVLINKMSQQVDIFWRMFVIRLRWRKCHSCWKKVLLVLWCKSGMFYTGIFVAIACMIFIVSPAVLLIVFLQDCSERVPHVVEFRGGMLCTCLLNPYCDSQGWNQWYSWLQNGFCILSHPQNSDCGLIFTSPLDTLFYIRIIVYSFHSTCCFYAIMMPYRLNSGTKVDILVLSSLAIYLLHCTTSAQWLSQCFGWYHYCY